MAGINIQGRLWRFSNVDGSDDSVGGAVPSGTILKENVFGRMEQLKSTQVLLEQGLELPVLFQALLYYTGEPLDIENNDEFQLYAPVISPFCNKGFRILGYRHSSHQDRRRFVEVTMKRVEKSRDELYQFQGASGYATPPTPPVPVYAPSLNFSDSRNSQYVSVI